MKRICLISLSNPFAGPYDGGKVDIRSRLDALSLFEDTEIDLYILSKPSDGDTVIDKSEYHIRNVYRYDIRDIKISMLFSKWPISIERRWHEQMAEELKKHQYDDAIYEGEYMVRYKRFVNSRKHLIRMHNIESEYRFELFRSETGTVKKITQLIECAKYRTIEKALYRQFDRYLFISADEQKRYQKLHPQFKDRYIWLPTSIKENKRKGCQILKNEMLYYGSLDIPNNYVSLKWFVVNVFNEVEKEREVKLKVIGKISAEKRDEIERLSDNIEVCGYVEDLESEIRKAALIVCPVLYGAGVKIKLIEALSYGKIILTNSKAVEGTTLKNNEELIVLDDKKEMVEVCLDILDNPHKYSALEDNAYEYYKKYHSKEAQAEILKELLTFCC